MSSTTVLVGVIAALQAIVREVMPNPPVEPVSSESYVPGEFIVNAQAALAAFGAEVKPAETAEVLA